MPRRVYQTDKFNGGMILNADPSDLPEGFGVAALNTMSSLDSGSISGRYNDVEEAGVNDVLDSCHISKDGGDPELVSLLVTDDEKWAVDGTVQPTVLGLTCVTGHRNYALLGRGRMKVPKYHGYPNGATSPVDCDNSFGVAVGSYATVVVDEEERHITLPHVEIGIGKSGGEAGYYTTLGGTAAGPLPGSCYFDSESIYYYAVSFVYDGYMHGPLHKFFSTTYSWIHPGTTTRYYLDRLQFIPTFSLSEDDGPRITSMVLYRAVGSPGTTDISQVSEYVRVHEFKKFDGTDEDRLWEDYNAVLTGSSYENDSGLSEAVTFCNIGYDMAHEMNNFLFVGSVGLYADLSDGRSNIQQFPEGQRMLYRSLRGKHCQFRVIDDYLALPFIPKAITGFNTRLVVFGSAEFAVVNPESMVVEDIIHGYGLDSPQMLYTTVQGVFFANSKNMYVYDGQQVAPIGTPVLRSSDPLVSATISALGIWPYEDLVASHGGVKRVIYSSRINSVLFLYYGPGSVAYAFVFSVANKTWSVSSFTSTIAASAYIDRSNNLYVGRASAFAAQATKDAWNFMTRRINFGNDSQTKKAYQIYPYGLLESVSDIMVSFDGSDFEVLPSYVLPSDWRRLNTLFMLFSPNYGGARLDGVEITYREMLNTK